MLLLGAAPADAATGPTGETMSLLWAVPFAGLLLSIAIWPLAGPAFWHHHYGKIAAAWAVAVLAPMVIAFGPLATAAVVVHTGLLEYLPFIILLLSLFVVTGGLRIISSFEATPAGNTAVLALGTVLAGWMGTTGASIILIRTLLRGNAWRKHRVHSVLFFIFLVSNIGGSITPLGDPPLFLGFLAGVPFFWPTVHLAMPTLIVALVLLAVFFVVDSWLMRDETPPQKPKEPHLRFEGLVNLPLLAGIIGAVLMSATWQPGISFEILGSHIELPDLVRDVVLLAITGLSLALTSRATRHGNDFSWEPIREVAKLFAGIFITIAPVIAILKAGESGALGGLVAMVTDDAGRPIDAMYFWLTGALSSFLDNAPTYLVFFNIAGGDPVHLTTDMNSTLVAISLGAVFMGANSYIGNAPNFMVRSIAKEFGVNMPSFFGYCGWAALVLLPVFGLVTVIYFW